MQNLSLAHAVLRVPSAGWGGGRQAGIGSCHFHFGARDQRPFAVSAMAFSYPS